MFYGGYGYGPGFGGGGWLAILIVIIVLFLIFCPGFNRGFNNHGPGPIC